jgi:formylglycine-generating enzyme required for sulfatase activity
VTHRTDEQTDLFVSYADDDRSWVLGYLVDALAAAGVRCRSEATFTLGRPRVLEFEQAIRGSRRTLLVLSPAYVADGFNQFTELLAQSYGAQTETWPVIPLVLHAVTLPPRLAMLTRLDATDPAQWPAVIERLCSELQRPVPASASKPPCPYPGMVPYSPSDARFFYGRDVEIRQMLQLLRHQRCLFVIGPSGSGKSSLVSAGLLPQLSTSSYFPTGYWLVNVVRPGNQPWQSLAALIGGDPNQPAQPLADLLARHPPAQRLLLVIDQFEEVFTQADRPERQRYLGALKSLRLLESCTLILTLRADFYPDLINSDLWPVDPGQRLEIGALRGGALRRAINQPAADVGVYLEAGLLERLLADAAEEPGALPLVQETMVLLWGRMERRLLTCRAYEELGSQGQSGLAVAMATKADAVIAALSEPQQIIARRIFLRLVQFGEGRADTRRQQPVAGLQSARDDAGQFEETLRRLADHRLLTLGGAEEGADRTVDIAHEMLIIGWPRARAWVQSRREAELARRRLQAKAAEWEQLGRGRGGLLDEVELLEAERWLASADAAELGHDESLPALVHLSRARLAAEEASGRRRTRFLVATSLFVAAAMTALGLFALLQLRRTEQAQREHALAQVDAIVEANPQAIPAMIKNLAPSRRWVDPRLRELLVLESNPSKRLRISLALLPVDPDQALYLSERFMHVTPDEFILVRDALVPNNDFQAALWFLLVDQASLPAQRFRAVCALAPYDSENPLWVELSPMIVASMLAEENPRLRETWQVALRPIGNALLGALEAKLLDDKERSATRDAAAVALADYAKDRPGLLARLTSEADPEQFLFMYGGLGHAIASGIIDSIREPNPKPDPSIEVRQTLLDLANEQPAQDLGETERIRLGRRRSGAAVALLLEPGSAFDMFRVGDDPEALTQFLHRLQDRRRFPRVVDELLKCLDRAREEQARYAVLLALGECDLQGLPAERRQALTDKLLDWYATDPSSAVHGAARWLLRRWGSGEAAAAVDRKPLAFDPTGKREWFVMEVRVGQRLPSGRFLETGTIHMTFVTFRPGEFVMGSAPSDTDRDEDESLHRVRMTRPFAIGMLELAREQYVSVMTQADRYAYDEAFSEFGPSGSHPAVGVSWNAAVEYCRLLTRLAGLAEADQCYEPINGASTVSSAPQRWSFHPERAGFRLPTEAEWEYACRSGTKTRFSWGSDPTVLDYGWFAENAGRRTNAGGQMRPNLRGLFDMHGNAQEWCHDWYGEYAGPDQHDPIGPPQGKSRVLRGGAWIYPAWHARAAARDFNLPGILFPHVGFRVVRTLPDVAREQ